MTKIYKTTVNSLIKQALKDEPTGDEFLDAQYDWYTNLKGYANPYYRFMYLLAQRAEPKAYLEIGVDKGLSIAHVASACPECECVGIDIWADSDEPMLRAQKVADHYPNIRYVRRWSTPEAGKRWVSLHPEISISVSAYHSERFGALEYAPKEIDMFLIDGWHDGELATKDWETYHPLLSQDAIVLCDDVHDEDDGYFEGMGPFWRMMQEQGRSIFNSGLHTGIGFGVVLT